MSSKKTTTNRSALRAEHRRVVISGAITTATAAVATSTSGATGKHGARVLGVDAFFVEQLPQVKQRLADRRADAAFGPGPHLRHQPEQERSADDDDDELHERHGDRRAEAGRPIVASRERHEDDDERDKAVREVAVHAAVLGAARELAPARRRDRSPGGRRALDRRHRPGSGSGSPARSTATRRRG